MGISCDLFCRVIDNLGDAGVCWRLARQLAREFGWRMRLWIDDPAPLALLAPDCADRVVEVRLWPPEFPEVEAADVVIEAFACDLPPGYQQAMATRARPPVWINLEYLSAESWLPGCHGLRSPHPRLPLTKFFFFPGFVAGTGGLLREADADFGNRAAGAAFSVTLFCYLNAALPALLECWRGGREPMTCRVAAGLPAEQVSAWLGQPFMPGTIVQRDALQLVALPFVAQPGFDKILGAADLNFVRGEDSFVRAFWAQRPFAWQPYPQAKGAHFAKLESFLSLYQDGLPPPIADAASGFFRAWNGRGTVETAWPPFRAAMAALTSHAPTWAARIASHGNLAENLVRFCHQRL